MLKRHAKKWFTLIEMLIVIVIIGILAAYLIPRISWAQGKARDVARKADLRQYSASLSSYMLDNRKYPAAQWCVNESLSGLMAGGYITSIDKDPGSVWGSGCADEYYYYNGNATHYYIISAVDEKTSANWCSDEHPAIWDTISKYEGKYSSTWCKDRDAAWFIQTD